jgi:hypothetical protein
LEIREVLSSLAGGLLGHGAPRGRDQAGGEGVHFYERVTPLSLALQSSRPSQVTWCSSNTLSGGKSCGKKQR